MENFEAAFAAFLDAARAACTADYLRFNNGVDKAHTDKYTPQLTVMRGQRYIRIVAETPGQRSSWCFVDTTNGDVLKCDGWKRPAKGARGNINDAQNGCGRVAWTGVR